MPERPTGTVTFLFTDIEGSTRRWEQDAALMQAALARHDAILRSSIESNDGYVFKTVGDAFCAAFGTATEALAAALEAQQRLEAEPWGAVGPLRVRMALQTGVAELRDDDYFGPPLNRVARLLSAAHGGQVLISLTTAELLRQQLPDGATLRDMGEHRLKDLVQPQRVFQLLHLGLPSEFPSLRSLDLHPNNLPVQATEFVGRELEVAAVRDRLLREDVHLLTLTGPGGTGKTRLALQVAADLIDRFADGVFVVPLAHTDDADLIPVAIAQELGLHEGGGQSLLDALKEYLREKRLLLLLDNFEHLLAGAPIVAELARTCPGLKSLVTSRAALRLYGEQEFGVPPLSLPDPNDMPPFEQLGQYEAVRLFIERARAVRPDFEVTSENAPALAEICHRLDGLPLAIELAAARIRILSPQAMLSRLERRLPLLTGGARDLPARQQTLRGAIAWGYDLLDDDEQRLFRRLSVFADGCTLEAAEAVCEGDDVFDGIESLVDRSLLRQVEMADGEPRFPMLGTIREFGQEQLDASEEGPAVRRRHAEYFLALSSEAKARLRGPEQVIWLERLETERDNLRAALTWFRQNGEAASALELAANGWWFWYLRSYLSEGREWLEDVLAMPGSAARTAGRARALFVAGALACIQGDFATARAHLNEGAAISQEQGETSNLGFCLTFLGQVHFFQGNYPSAYTCFKESQALFRETGEQWGVALSYFLMANAELAAGEYEAARASSAESRRIFRELGDQSGYAFPLAILGRIALQTGDLAAARQHLEESLEIRRTRDKWGTAQLLNGLGDVARAAEDYGQAGDRYRESLRLFQETGSPNGKASVLHNLAYVAQHDGDAMRAEALFKAGLAAFQRLGDRRGVADCLTGLAGLAAGAQQLERAARLFGGADGILEALSAARSAPNVADYERNLAIVRDGLGEAAFETFVAEGRALSLEDAVALAVDKPIAEAVTS